MSMVASDAVPTAPPDLGCSEVRECLNAAIGAVDPSAKPFDRWELVRESAAVADGATIFLLDARIILMIAPERFPDAMCEHVAAIRAMHAQLTPTANRVMPPILGEGTLGPRSFFMMPALTPLKMGRFSGWLDRRQIGPAILEWLYELVHIGPEGVTNADRTFVANLTALAAMPDVETAIRGHAQTLAARIEQSQLTMAHVPMHGDLWSGNIMRNADSRLAIIDWCGSTPHGFAIYDLVRLAQSFGLPASRLGQEVARHASAMGQGPDGPFAHLLAALGHFAQHLGEFPRSKFVRLASECYSTLSRSAR